MHKEFFKIGIPLMLANITIPLVGFVDLWTLSQSNIVQYIAAASLGAGIIGLLLWVFSFFLSGETAITAINNSQKASIVNAKLIENLSYAILIGLVVIVFQNMIFNAFTQFLHTSTVVLSLVSDYFFIRINNLPIILCEFVIIGWFIGRKKPLQALLILLTNNIINILLDILFVFHFNMAIKGVALASVLAEITAFSLALFLVHIDVKWQHLVSLIKHIKMRSAIELLKFNIILFFRSLTITLSYLIMLYMSAALNDIILASNAILLNLMLIIMFFLDGFGQATATMIGNLVGKNDYKQVNICFKVTLLWLTLITLLCMILVGFFYQNIIHFLTSNQDLTTIIFNRYWIIVFIILLLGWATWLENVLLGVLATRTLLFAALSGFIVYILIITNHNQQLSNEILWNGFYIFFLCRCIFITLSSYFISRKNWHRLRQKDNPNTV